MTTKDRVHLLLRCLRLERRIVILTYQRDQWRALARQGKQKRQK